MLTLYHPRKLGEGRGANERDIYAILLSTLCMFPEDRVRKFHENMRTVFSVTQLCCYQFIPLDICTLHR